MFKQGFQHPKLIKLLEIVEQHIKKNPEAKIMVFNQYRDNALDIKEQLNKVPGVKAELFVGQQKKAETGMSQKEQKQIIQDFSEGKINVLCATSIGEEGLDIPEVNKVIFYEPVPSEIRKIQRCLPPDSKILMEKGNYKEVSKICKKEKVISYNEKKDELEAKEVLGVFKNGVQKIIEVITEKNNQIRLTKNHPILTPSGWINAGNLKKLDIIAICHSPNTKTNYNSMSDFLPKEAYICNNENLKIAMNKKKLTYEDLQKELSHLGHKINKKTLWGYINIDSIPIHIFKSMMEIPTWQL